MVAQRVASESSAQQIAQGIPLFLDQLTQTLKAEIAGGDDESLKISGSRLGDEDALSEIGVSAAAHGKVLLELGFTVEQVVHDYGDLCQSITDLAVERDAPFSVSEFRTLNRCLDNAIADAVGEFSRERDVFAANRNAVEANQRLGFLVHELRNHLQTATLAFSALEAGKLAVGGSTSGLVKRSLTALSNLLDDAIHDVRLHAPAAHRATFSVAALVADAASAASVYAGATGCTLNVPTVDPSLEISGNRVLLSAALANLLQNAFKFTRPNTEVYLIAFAAGDRLLLQVRDHCGGLPSGAAQRLFEPFAQADSDKSGLGLGLSIARKSVQADGGALTVEDLPGEGCVFTIELPLQ